MRFSLFHRLLLCLIVTLSVIGGVVAGFVAVQSLLPADSPLRLDITPRLLVMAGRVAGELSSSPAAEWEAVLARYSSETGLELSLYSNAGRRLAGRADELPPEVFEVLTSSSRGTRGVIAELGTQPVPPPVSQRAPHSLNGPPTRGLAGEGAQALEAPLFALRTSGSGGYWAGVRMAVVEAPGSPAVPATLLAVSRAFAGRGIQWQPQPFIALVISVGGAVVLLWLGIARRIAQPIQRMTEVAVAIAGGRFEARVEAERGDELGRLGRAINEMSARLDGHMRAQKRFLGDVSHELASPIARIRLGLEIIASRSRGALVEELRDVQEDVQYMSELVEELLVFARAEVAPHQADLVSFEVDGVVARALRREAEQGAAVEARVPAGLKVMADQDLLVRALGNVLRNAFRYAGDKGPIVVEAQREGGMVRLEVRDSGPGVGEEVLGRIFEPFFRPEEARTAESGGAGLGLAIVKSVVTACGGTVQARNLSPQGFAISMWLPASSQNLHKPAVILNPR